jgi:arginyl-tRNA synthetase
MILYGYRHFADRTAYAANPVAELGRVYREVRRLIEYHEVRNGLPTERTKLEELEKKLSRAQAQAPTGDAKADKKAAKIAAKLAEDVRKQQAAIQAKQQQLDAVTDDPAASQQATRHADIAQAVLRETAGLHAGDEENVRLWKEFLPVCRAEIDRIYQRLGVSFDVELGESFYHQRLADVVDQLRRRGLARDSEGAVCVFLDGYDSPMIVRKTDGAFLYSTTDLATIEYRVERWRPDAILYVVDFRQGEHFGKLFAAAQAWGFDEIELAHISFGTVLGEDGKPFRTRSGDTVSLEGLLDEAVRRAYVVVSENDDAKRDGPELSPVQREHVAQVIGHAAIKYADLSQNRTSDYVFSYDKMVAMQGNTATYLQYSFARIQNIFAKGGVDPAALREGPPRLELTEDRERALALQILQLDESLADVVVDYRPNLLTNYLYQLAKRFAEFYEVCPVLKAESASTRESRLVLCDLTARTLQLGLSLLGIQVVEKM